MNYEVNLYRDFCSKKIKGTFRHLQTSQIRYLGNNAKDVASEILKIIPKDISRLTVINSEKSYQLDLPEAKGDSCSPGLPLEKKLFTEIKDELFKRRKDLTYRFFQPVSFNKPIVS